MIVGYARISSQLQDLEPQIVALEGAGCVRIFHEVASGNRADRPELTNALEVLSPRDTLVVCRLDRVGRSIEHVVELIRYLHDRSVEFQSLDEALDTTQYRTVYHTIAALAQMSGDLRSDQMDEDDHKPVRARGRKGGRPRVLDENKLALVRRLYKNGDVPPREICRLLGISRATLYRYVSPKRAQGRDAMMK